LQSRSHVPGIPAQSMAPQTRCALIFAVGSLWLIVASPVTLAADGRALAMNGNANGAPACSACHGAQGEGQPAAGFPRLDGLNAAYIRQQLDDFADGKRESDIMSPIAKGLSPDERQAVASFYSAQAAAKATEPKQADAKTIAHGAALALHGDWPKDLPGCNQCHGPDGQGVAGTFPKLAAQNSEYIVQELKKWQQGKRDNDPLHLMKSVSTKLGDDEIAAVAAYYAGLPIAPARQQGTAQ
jgi:cytochrome c553